MQGHIIIRCYHPIKPVGIRYREIIWTGMMVVLADGNGLLIPLDASSCSLAGVIDTEIVAGIGGRVNYLFLSPLIALQAHVSQEDTTATSTSTLGFLLKF